MTAVDAVMAEKAGVKEISNSASPSTVVENRYTANVTPARDTKDDVLFSPELLAMYYSRLFPFHLLYTWLNYDDLFSRREISYTLLNDGEEIYLRYNCFSTEEALKESILNRKPIKIDIGAVFERPPKDKKAISDGTLHTEQRELVFDIDLTDYDDIRRCGCSGATICGKCWGMMNMAVKVMDQGLREDFAFKHICWFYSGRRGIHAWVCDHEARTLSNEARSAIASYFEVSLGTDKNNKVSLPHPLHPMLARAFSILEPMFVRNILPASGHGLLANEEGWTILLQALPEAAEPVKTNLLKKWSNAPNQSTPAEKWSQLKEHLQVFIRKSKGKDQKTMTAGDRIRIENWPVEAVFRYTYPRLDINVSKMQNHLLKSPFCVHPKTGRVCVPIDDIDTFDPFSVPTLPQLMRELDEYEGGDTRYEWQKTSLKESFQTFQKNFLEPMTREIRLEKRAASEKKAAVNGDF